MNLLMSAAPSKPEPSQPRLGRSLDRFAESIDHVGLQLQTNGAMALIVVDASAMGAE